MIATDYQLITSPEQLRVAIDQLSAYRAVGFDTETTSLDPYNGRLRLIQVAAPDGVRIVDLDRFANGDMKESEALAPLRALLAGLRPIKVIHNAKFDAKFVKHNFGVDMGGLFDTLLASQLVAAGEFEERHGLDVVALRYLDEIIDKAERMSDWRGELNDAQLRYAARDAAVLLPLREKLIEHLQREGLVRCAQLEFECVQAVAAMELAGIYIDKERWREQMVKVECERDRLADELQCMLAEGSSQGTLFGRAEINLDSQMQLTDALRGMGVPVTDSTRNWKLQPLAAEYPVVAKLLEYRTVQKATTSYGANILEVISPITGRIHADFRQIGAPSGRFACTNPNIQQVPHSPDYRRCFRAPEGRKLVIADYSQIELRILAEFSGDPAFIDAFVSGADLHSVTASQVFGVTPDQVTVEQRSFAKRLNFGVVYGIGAQRFAMMTGLSVYEAESVLRKYFSTYRMLDAWLREAARKVVKEMMARTASGRLARFRFDPQDRAAVSAAERMGKNTPIQGTSADILKRALRILHDDLSGTSAEIVNIVHDEVVVEADEDEAVEIAKSVERAMVAAGEEYLRRVPVKVEAEVADEWVK